VAAVRKVRFVYTNIGRGHPYYLDGIIEALVRSGRIGIARNQTDVFELSRGASLLAWRVARYLYRRGSSGGPTGRLYSRIRSDADYNRRSRLLDIMGKDLRRALADSSDPVVVAHPSLVGILRGREDLIYQHGEVVAPRESLVNGASLVVVPTDGVAQLFISRGYRPSEIFVSGLCIEPALVKQAADSFERRIAPLQNSNCLVGAYFSSGAEPADHVAMLVEAAVSAVMSGGHALIFAAHNGRLIKQAADTIQSNRLALSVLGVQGDLDVTSAGATLIPFASRREETSLTARLFATFDYLVAPSHERTNWSLGLGLPMFILSPVVGPFAPLNRDALLRAQVAEQLTAQCTPRTFGERLNHLRRSGRLLNMAQAGWGRFNLDGFHKIAALLHERYGAT
jgi:hypothetical protein